jgi:hypothetical protein
MVNPIEAAAVVSKNLRRLSFIGEAMVSDFSIMIINYPRKVKDNIPETEPQFTNGHGHFLYRIRNFHPPHSGPKTENGA